MLRQYNPQRFRYQAIAGRFLAVGTIPAGTLFRYGGDLCIVDAWLPREICAWSKDRFGNWQSCFVGNAGHLARCRNLRNGSVFDVADHIIRNAIGDD